MRCLFLQMLIIMERKVHNKLAFYIKKDENITLYIDFSVDTVAKRTDHNTWDNSNDAKGIILTPGKG